MPLIARFLNLSLATKTKVQSFFLTQLEMILADVRYKQENLFGASQELTDWTIA